MGFFDSVVKKNLDNNKKMQKNNAFHEAKSKSFPCLFEMLRSGIDPNPNADVMIEHIKEEKDVQGQYTGDVSVHTNTVKNHDELVEKIGHKKQNADSPELSNIKNLQTQITESQKLIDEFNANGDFSAAYKEDSRLADLKNELQKAINKYSDASAPKAVDISSGNVVSAPTSTQEPLRPSDDNKEADNNNPSTELNIDYSNNESNKEPIQNDSNLDGNDQNKEPERSILGEESNNQTNNNEFETDENNDNVSPESSLSNVQNEIQDDTLNDDLSNHSVTDNQESLTPDVDGLSKEDRQELLQQVINNSNEYRDSLPLDLSDKEKDSFQDKYIESHLPKQMADDYRKQMDAIMSLPPEKIAKLAEQDQNNNYQELSDNDDQGELLDVGYTDETQSSNDDLGNDSFEIIALVIDPTFNTEVEIQFDNQLLNSLSAIMLNGSQIFMLDNSGNVSCLVDSETDINVLQNNNSNYTYYKVSSDFDDLKSKLIVWLDSLENVHKNSLMNIDKYIINH